MMITPMLTALLLLAGEGPRAEPTQHLRLELQVPETTVLVGQPTKVLIVASADVEMPFFPDGVWLMISDGTGFRAYRSPHFGGTPAILVPPTVGPGKTEDVQHRIDIVRNGSNQPEDASHQFVFGAPGKYLVKARYDVGGASVPRVVQESNVETIVVKAPSGRDRELFETHLRFHPELVYQGGASDPMIDPKIWKLTRKLCEKYGDSPYLSAVQLTVWVDDLGRAMDRAATTAAARQAATAVLRDVAGRALPGPFDEDRLLMIADRWLMFDRAEARRTYELIRQRYPQSAAARKAEEWIREEDEGARASEEVIKETQKLLREHGIELPTPSPTPPPPE